MKYTVRSTNFRTDIFLNNRTRAIYWPTHLLSNINQHPLTHRVSFVYLQQCSSYNLSCKVSFIYTSWGNEQRVPIKFCLKASLFATETLLGAKGLWEWGSEPIKRFQVLFSISRRKGAGRKWRERWPPKIEWNWGKHCWCCWFGQKWPSNRIRNVSRIYEHPQL